MFTKLPRCLRYVDRSSMAFGNEARLPLLNNSIVELGFYSKNDAKIDEFNFRKFPFDKQKLNFQKVLKRQVKFLSHKASFSLPHYLDPGNSEWILVCPL